MHVGRETSESKVASVEGDLETYRPRRLEQLHTTQSVPSPISNDTTTHLSNDHVLFERCESNDGREEDLLVLIKVLSHDKLHGVPIRIDCPLTPLLVPIRLAEDDLLVDPQLAIPSPRTHSHVLLDLVPVPPVVLGIVRDSPARLAIDLAAILHARPDEPVGTEGVKVEEGDSERVGIGRCVERVPREGLVRRVVDDAGGSDEVRAVAGVGVHRHRDDVQSVRDFVPRVSLVGRLPDLVVGRECQ
jgi:hypothetical protein